ncbi:hypothetical protein THTE_3727 [Thermogutta terrifontis]|uniref:Uncharacterized protein n=1 Tax=Thermogutta terrifontis TaxID=1331910 RepID=A0A286RK41_9BACT|nr:hypothetical protein THTE_3727 [Thermogutta terrifontis]
MTVVYHVVPKHRDTARTNRKSGRQQLCWVKRFTDATCHRPI